VSGGNAEWARICTYSYMQIYIHTLHTKYTTHTHTHVLAYICTHTYIHYTPSTPHTQAMQNGHAFVHTHICKYTYTHHTPNTPHTCTHMYMLIYARLHTHVTH